MTNEEAQEVLDGMQNVRPEMLNENAKRLFDAIMLIADQRDLFKEEIERLNNIINELKWKPIEEYDKGNYDWVLVKYFDKDYECIPCVAEKRFEKWYSIDEKEIQFDVKYFFDMQRIDKLQELKGSNDPSFEEMVGFVENVCKDIKSQSTLHEELEKERKTIAKIVGDFKEVNTENEELGGNKKNT